MPISATFTSVSRLERRLWWRAETNLRHSGMRHLVQAPHPYSRSWLWIPGSLVSLAPRNDGQEAKSRAICAAFLFSELEIRGDAFVFPVAIAGRFRGLRGPEFPC